MFLCIREILAIFPLKIKINNKNNINKTQVNNNNKKDSNTNLGTFEGFVFFVPNAVVTNWC